LVFGPWRPECTVAPAFAHRPRRDHVGPAHRGRLRTPGPCAAAALAEPPSWSSPRAPRVHACRADRPTATSPYARRAAPALLLAVARRHHLTVPMPWMVVTPSSRHACLQKGLNSPPRALPRAPSRHCHRQWRRRRAPPSGRLYRQRVLLLPALGPPVASPLAYCSGQAASSLESELPRPPPSSLCRTRAFACSPSQWALVASPLDHPEARCAAHCSAEPFPSPPRPCCPCAAAAARRRSLRPSYHRQSLRGEPNRIPRRLFACPCTPSPPASSPSPSGPRGDKGLIVKVLKVLGS
jgi:hypothetical protein